jgi:glycosyltransferase involved in cell wall biosynthesis
MRILMLAPHPNVRGPLPKHTPVLVDALRATGCEVVSEPWGRHSDSETVITKVIGPARDIPRIRCRLKSQPFDVMVVKTSHEPRSLLRALPLLAAVRHLAPKIVVQFHGGRSDLLVASGHRALKAATAAVFALSDGVLFLSSEEARETAAFWPRGRFRVVANPYVVAPEDLNGASRGNGDRPPSLLFVGRLIREKGIYETLTAFAEVSRQRDCHLVIVGNGPEEDEVGRRVAMLGLKEKVTLAGFLEGKSLHDAYRAADVFVFPSYREGFPTAITEAMSAALPVVTTQTRGMADHLVGDTNALFVPPRQTEPLIAALQRVLSDHALRERMSAANHAKVADFAPEAVAGHYRRMLEEIIGDKPGAGEPGAGTMPGGDGAGKPRV